MRLFKHLPFGDNSAIVLQQAVARMLFWGQQGLSPNIQEAIKHYRRGAVELEDPVSMYDYGVVLLQVRYYLMHTEKKHEYGSNFKVLNMHLLFLKGQGVEKDIPKAVTFLKKAMEQV